MQSQTCDDERGCARQWVCNRCGAFQDVGAIAALGADAGGRELGRLCRGHAECFTSVTLRRRGSPAPADDLCALASRQTASIIAAGEATPLPTMSSTRNDETRAGLSIARPAVACHAGSIAAIWPWSRSITMKASPPCLLKQGLPQARRACRATPDY